IDNTFKNGIRFEGSDGWIFVTRGAERVTESNPMPPGRAGSAFVASKEEIIKTPLGAKDVRLHTSPNGDHHLDWITSILSRKPGATAPELAHRSTSACALGWIAMKLGRKLAWNPEKEEFVNDDSANQMRFRPQRAPYGLNHIRRG
ncbi:MAG: gfo/Idh/MocA family oxidoreductase, partial [Verrucomicrobia bacterium]|nr:gfo/Idh/MocA family oxidoreductase [Verrucomicrobiota bacterium]